jgi:hypothetical protein
MPSSIATLVAMFIVILFPVLIPVTVTAFHGVAELRRRRMNARPKCDRIGYDAEPIPAPA